MNRVQRMYTGCAISLGMLVGHALAGEGLPTATASATSAVCLKTSIQGQDQPAEWRPALEGWEVRDDTLIAKDTRQSELYSGEGARIFLPQTISGDFEFGCQYLLPDNSTGAGGPVVYFRGQPDGVLHAFRHINYWGTAVLHKKRPGQPWVQIAYATGRDFAVAAWHDLTIRGRGSKISVEIDGQGLIEGDDSEFRAGFVGLGCQVRQVQFRKVRVSGEAVSLIEGWGVLPDPPRHVVVCGDAGRGGYQAFPGLCRLKNGDLLAVFYAGWGHVSRPGERIATGGAVSVCRSADNGKTWGPARTILDTPYDDRDPAVWQCDDGAVCVSAVAVDWPKYQAPYDNWCHTFTVVSTDNGHTWSPPKEMNIGSKYDYTVWTEPRRLKNGDWLLPVYRNRGAQLNTAFLRSMDGGHTWGSPQVLDEKADTTDEPDICQLADGSLFCAMRPEKERYMWQSRSDDNGRTWSRPTPLPFYGHCANLLRTSSGVTLLGHRDPGMTVHHSVDEAKTWAGAAMIDPCGGAYSQMVELPDGRILIVYYTEGAQSQIRAQFMKVDKSGIRVVGP